MTELILVSPHFPPTNAPDHQRVRLSLPYWKDHGFNPQVIAVESEQVAAPADPFLVELLPVAVPVQRVHALSLRWSRIPGLGTLGYRCRGAIRRALLARLTHQPSSSPCLVYFSTTQFPVQTMIPALARRFPHVRWVIDYQDPWVNDHYRRHPNLPVPGGRLKFGFVQWLARRAEPRTLASVHGITTVSSRYRDVLSERYQFASRLPWVEVPFGGAASDFERLATSSIRQSCFDPTDGLIHWVYVGRGGADLETAVRALARALRESRESLPELRRVRIHFLGTDYAPPERARPTLAPLAAAEGAGEWVRERPRRLPYGEAICCLRDAHAIVVPGSNDPSYSASKIYPCILARKPLLALFHRDSPIHAIMRKTRSGVHLGFDPLTTVADLAATIRREWFENGAFHRVPVTDWAAFEPFSDRSMTARLARFFNEVMTHSTETKT